MTNHRMFAALALCAAATTTSLAAQHASLLFVTKQPEHTRSGSGGTALGVLTERAIGLVTPGNQCKYSAYKYSPLMAQQTLFGDEDNDANDTIYRPGLFGSIKAILVKPYVWDHERKLALPRTRPIDLRDVYFTPGSSPGAAISGVSVRRGDCAVTVRDGQIRFFIRAEQIITALGMVDQNRQRLDPKDLCLDGITVDRDRNIFLTFEDDHLLQLKCGGALATYTLQDGGVAVIPGARWLPNVHGDVANVAANRGLIALSEAQVDAMVVNANVNDVAGNCLLAAKDTDGLAIDRNGGVFQVKFCNNVYTFPNLLFAVETGTGSSVLTTAANGQIATANGCALGSPCGGGATDGQQMGLQASTTMQSLDGLASLGAEPCVFTIGTPEPRGLATGNSEWHFVTNMAVGGVSFQIGNSTVDIAPATPIAAYALPTDCFPEVFLDAFWLGPVVVPMAADGWGGRYGTLGPFPLPAALFPNGCIGQAIVFYNGKWQASTPLTLVQ